MKRALSNVPPTSVECERVFSSLRFFLNDHRQSMSLEILDALIVCKRFYTQKKENES